MELLPQQQLAHSTVLDLGCGTGFFSQQLALQSHCLMALDLSERMLEHAYQRCGDAVTYIVGDAEQLPLATNSVDFVFSSLALQWCHDLSLPLKEIKRVLKPGGSAVFSTLLDGSLSELKQAWKTVDKHRHVNNFLTHEEVNKCCLSAGFNEARVTQQAVTLGYASGMALMKDLKGIGATHLTEGRANGLIGRAKFRQLEDAYALFRQQDGLLPATYQVGFGVVTNE